MKAVSYAKRGPVASGNVPALPQDRHHPVRGSAPTKAKGHGERPRRKDGDMDWNLLLNWVTVICGPLAIILLLAFLATGRRNQALRWAGATALLFSTVAFGLTRYVIT